MNNWNRMTTEEKVNFIRAQAALGLSASMISALLPGSTRNAVIGVANRNQLKLKGRSPGNSSNLRQNKEKASAENVVPLAPKPKPKAPKVTKVKPRPAKVLAFVKPSAPVQFLQLNDKTCRWPLNHSYKGLDPEDMMFCGQATDVGSHYCKKCRKKSFGGLAGKRAAKDIDGPASTKRERKPFIRWLR